MNKPKIIVILGPTATGKSDLAVELARKFNGEVISADSRQVYKKLDIGTGKITKKEMHGIPHYLLDVVSPRRTFTVAEYQVLAKKALQKILKNGKMPIICGGTGLYIDALIYDYALPEVPPNLNLRMKLEKKATEALFMRLKKMDPRRARAIDRHNRRRLIRALEIVLITGKPVPTLPALSLSKGRQSPYDILKIGIYMPSEVLCERIEERLKKRMANGMVREVKKLHSRRLSWKRMDELGLEYRYLSRYLRKLISRPEMAEILNSEIWQYAKRQMTWFKRDKEIHWIRKQEEALKLARRWLKSKEAQ